jgi:arginase
MGYFCTSIDFMELEILVNNSELGAGTRGASLGFHALEVAAWKNGNTLFKDIPITHLETYNHLLYERDKSVCAKYIKGIEKVYANLQMEVPKILNKGAFPLIIAGDHSSAGGTLAALKSYYKNERIGVIWIDAHADIHSPYTTPSGNVHGMPLATALGFDENGPNEVSDEVKRIWKNLIHIGGISPKVKSEDLKMVGVRSLEKEEVLTLNQLNIKNWSMGEIRALGPKILSETLLLNLNHCDKLYLAFDVDSMDSELVSEGTGTPMKNGLTPEEAQGLISELLKSPKICCFELVEINPTLDNKRNLMAETALEILDIAVEEIRRKTQK